jgi:hypothetical protein
MNSARTDTAPRPAVVPDVVMPDPDNLQIDPDTLPLTGPVTLPTPRTQQSDATALDRG